MESLLLVLIIALTVLAAGCLVTAVTVIREVLKNAKSTPEEVRATLDQVLIHFKAQNLTEKASYDATVSQNNIWLKDMEKKLETASEKQGTMTGSYVTDDMGRRFDINDLEPTFELEHPEAPVS